MAGWFVPPPNRQGDKRQVRTLMATLRSAPRGTRQLNLAVISAVERAIVWFLCAKNIERIVIDFFFFLFCRLDIWTINQQS